MPDWNIDYDRLREHLRHGPDTLRVLRRTGLLRELGKNPLATFRALQGEAPSLRNVHRIVAVRHPDRVAVCDPSRSLTYAAIDDAIDRCASLLREWFQVSRGDRVVLMSENRVEYVVLWFALFRLGAVAVHASYELRDEELDYVVSHSGAKLICVSTTGMKVAAEVARRRHHGAFPVLHIDGLHEPDGDAEQQDHHKARVMSLSANFRLARPTLLPEVDQGQSVVYTSGTTGRPKGAVRNFSAMTATELACILERLPLRTGERFLVVGRLYHSAAQAFSGMVSVLGGTLVLRSRFDAVGLFDDIRREAIESVFLVPNMMERALDAEPEASRGAALPTLRAVISGAAPFPQPLRERMAARLGPERLFDFYGATELGWVTTVNGTEMLARPGTVGRAVRGHEISIRDISGKPLWPSEIGIVWTRSAQRMEQYLGDEDATSEAIRDGWTTVEDLGYLDADGYLFLSGRARDMIISGGVNIYPAEVEAALMRHEDIADAAVFGLPDPQWGEVVCAAVVARPGRSLPGSGELRSWALGRMAPAKAPRRWFVLGELPRNPTGKVLKRALREHFGSAEATGPVA
jgi:fatty-acyl-CoA synthase